MKKTPLTPFGQRQVELLATLRKLQEQARAVADELLGDLIGDLPAVKLPKPRPAKVKQDKAIAAESFKAFKAAYPRPTGMERAKAIWITLNPSPELAAEIVEKVNLFHRTTWLNRETDKIPHASTFLHQKRWKDEPEPPARAPGPDRGRLPAAHDGPVEDLFAKHIDRLKAALARGAVSLMLEAPKLAAVVKTVNNLSLDRANREAAQGKLEKIEARLLEVVTAGLGDLSRQECEKFAGEALGPNLGRMSAGDWEGAKRRAFDNEVRKMAGLPTPW